MYDKLFLCRVWHGLRKVKAFVTEADVQLGQVCWVWKSVQAARLGVKYSRSSA
jgi:hypothetical protein